MPPKALKIRQHQPKEANGGRRASSANLIAQAAQVQASAPDYKARESASKVLKYLDDYRSPTDTKSLKEEGYEIDYDRLVGVGANSAVFLAHPISAPQPPAVKGGQKPLYTPGYDIAVKITAKKWINAKRPSKTRTGNLKLALALGQTKVENNILKVIDVFKTNERIFVFMQYCAYGNVISFIRRNGKVPSKFARRWCQQMSQALSFLHKFHVAHRNYKLENVLIDDNLNAKLTGFGLSKFCVDLQTRQIIMSKTICGSEPYLAPEMLKAASERNYDPKQADVWAYGVGVFLCITRRYPFEADSLRALKQEQLAHRYLEHDLKRRIRSQVKELLKMTFVIDPQHRPTMEELCKTSSWLREYQHPSRPSQQQQQQQQHQPAQQQQMASKLPLQMAPHVANEQEQTPKSPVVETETSSTHTRADNSGGNGNRHKNEDSDGQTLSPVTPMSLMASDALPNPSQISRIE